ncbi:hypothetical protein GCM10009819_07540 [Agromyces tropicus]|uniref:SnoaL-like domain-containing protein n=1 Tax=Agromyces tropicus TaxID=555371 RepID=A0ABN2U2J4_9MICO
MSDRLEKCAPAWAHTVGLMDLQPPSRVPTTVTELADRMLAQETAVRYAVAYDERRLDVIDALVVDDVSFAYRVGTGPLETITGRANVLAWLEDVMASQSDQRRHLVGSVLVEHLTADRATVVCYSAIVGIEDVAELVTTTVYVFSLVKRDDRWLILSAVDGLDRPF